jgi:hypothetical protein
MFELTKQTPSTNDVVTVAAPTGYAIFYFAPPPQTKPAFQPLNELIATFTFPVVAWRLHGDRADPVTIIDQPAGATRYVFFGQKIYELDNPTRPNWNDPEKWRHAVLALWKASRQKEPASLPPGQATIRPGEGVAIFRR